MKNRYLFLKRLYPDYLILFKKKNNIISYKLDNQMLDFIGYDNLMKSNINYILVDDKNNIVKYSYPNNEYYKYYKQFSLYKIINAIIINLNKYN